MKLEDIATRAREHDANSTTGQLARGAAMTPELEAQRRTETETSVQHFKRI
jgi:hypothetical protein